MPRHDALGTQAIPSLAPPVVEPPHGTQPMMVASTALQNMEAPRTPVQTQSIPTSPMAPTQLMPIPTPSSPSAVEPTQAIPLPPTFPSKAAPTHSPKPGNTTSPHPSRLPWIIAGIIGLGCIAGASMLWFHPGLFGLTRAVPPVEASPDEIPAVLVPYLERAKAGDTKAMRMLGTRYTYGLEVPANPRLGRSWYQKAADAGDATAKAELAQLGP